MACWDSLERFFHEEFKYEIRILIFCHQYMSAYMWTHTDDTISIYRFHIWIPYEKTFPTNPNMPYLPLMVSQQLSSVRSGCAFAPRACRGKLLTQAITLKPGTENDIQTNIRVAVYNCIHHQLTDTKSSYNATVSTNKMKQIIPLEF